MLALGIKQNKFLLHASLDFCYFQHKFYFLQIILLGSDLPDICGVTVVTVQCRDLPEVSSDSTNSGEYLFQKKEQSNNDTDRWLNAYSNLSNIKVTNKRWTESDTLIMDLNILSSCLFSPTNLANEW